MAKRRIVVTGMGLVSCLGSDIDIYYQRLLNGESGVKPITQFDVDTLPTKFAAYVQDFDPTDYVDRKQLRRADPYINYALYAGKRALEHAGLDQDAFKNLDRTRCGVIVGSGMGGMEKFHDGVRAFIEKGARRVSPFFVPYIITNMGGALLGMEAGFQGPNYSISTACATGNFCVAAAADHILKGECDLILCGGMEATQDPVPLGGFVACRALSERNDEPQKASRPFDQNRDGFVLGEGGGVLVLEELEHAKRRGAPILAEVLGWGTSCDAYHMTNIRQDGSGIALCIEKAIKDIPKERINYVNCHATSTPLGDMAEMRGVELVFKDQCKKMKANAPKSMTGHALGGASAIELIGTICQIQGNKLHPTINLENPEEDIKMDVCANKAQDFEIDVAIKNAFGFGGHNACIALSRYQD